MRPCAALNAKKNCMYSGSILKCFNFDDHGSWKSEIYYLKVLAYLIQSLHMNGVYFSVYFSTKTTIMGTTADATVTQMIIDILYKDFCISLQAHSA